LVGQPENFLIGQPYNSFATKSNRITPMLILIFLFEAYTPHISFHDALAKTLLPNEFGFG
jgi:hypothetical protein